MVQSPDFVMSNPLPGTEVTLKDSITYKGYIATELQGHYYSNTQFGGFSLLFEADPSYLWEP